MIHIKLLNNTQNVAFYFDFLLFTDYIMHIIILPCSPSPASLEPMLSLFSSYSSRILETNISVVCRICSIFGRNFCINKNIICFNFYIN